MCIRDRNEKPTAEAASYDKYKGDKNHAFWYFDKEMADATEKYYANERGKTEQYLSLIHILNIYHQIIFSTFTNCIMQPGTPTLITYLYKTCLLYTSYSKGFLSLSDAKLHTISPYFQTIEALFYLN